MAIVTDIILQGFQMFLVLLLAPLLTGVVRKTKARIMRRKGASVFQPYRDILRLLRKETVIADNASWIYCFTPYIVFVSTWVVAALIPTFSVGLPFNWAVDLIAIVAILGTARFFLALAGLDIGTSFGGIGSSREMMIASLAEPAMFMVVFSLALLTGTTHLSDIITIIQSGEVGIRVTLGLSLVAMIMVAIAENARIPIDNPSTHLELTMVHEAMVLEYSGRHLALIEMASSLKLLLYISLLSCLFIPWGIASATGDISTLAIGLLSYIIKVGFYGVLLALFESTIAKMRVFRVSDFLGGAFMLGILGTLLLFISKGL